MCTCVVLSLSAFVCYRMCFSFSVCVCECVRVFCCMTLREDVCVCVSVFSCVYFFVFKVLTTKKGVAGGGVRISKLPRCSLCAENNIAQTVCFETKLLHLFAEHLDELVGTEFAVRIIKVMMKIRTGMLRNWWLFPGLRSFYPLSQQ